MVIIIVFDDYDDYTSTIILERILRTNFLYERRFFTYM